MIYLQQSKGNKNSFCQVEKRSQASHFNSDGNIRPISELEEDAEVERDEAGNLIIQVKKGQQGTKPNEEQPLETLAVVALDEKKDEKVDNILDLPSTAPKHEENQEELKLHTAGEEEEEEAEDEDK